MTTTKETFTRLYVRLGIAEALTDEQMNTSVYELGADSLDVVDLTIAVEEEFGIELPDEEVFAKPDAGFSGREALALDTPNQWIAHIERKISGKDT